MAASAFARFLLLRFALPIAGWTAAIASVLLFGLPPLVAIMLLLLATSPALFAPSGPPQ